MVVVIVTLLTPQLEPDAGLPAGLLERIRQQLTLVGELIGNALIDQDLQYRCAGPDQFHGLVGSPVCLIVTGTGRVTTLPPATLHWTTDRR